MEPRFTSPSCCGHLPEADACLLRHQLECNGLLGRANVGVAIRCAALVHAGFALAIDFQLRAGIALTGTAPTHVATQLFSKGAEHGTNDVPRGGGWDAWNFTFVP